MVSGGLESFCWPTAHIAGASPRRGPQSPGVVLSDRLRGMLEHLARRQTSSQRVMLRLQIVLAAADGGNNDQIASSLALHRTTAQVRQTRWLTRGPYLEAAVIAGDDERLLARLVAVFFRRCSPVRRTANL